MPREHHRDGYFAFDWTDAEGAFDLNEILRLHPSLIEGHFAANASFDSGRFKPSESDLSACWTFCNGTAISPRMLRGQQLPMHCCAPYDEWYIFEEYPVLKSLGAFCNHIGFSPIDYGWKEMLEDFWTQIETLRPLHCIGDGDFPYFVTRSVEAAFLARSTGPAAAGNEGHNGAD